MMPHLCFRKQWSKVPFFFSPQFPWPPMPGRAVPGFGFGFGGRKERRREDWYVQIMSWIVKSTYGRDGPCRYGVLRAMDTIRLCNNNECQSCNIRRVTGLVRTPNGVTVGTISPDPGTEASETQRRKKISLSNLPAGLEAILVMNHQLLGRRLSFEL